MNTLNRREFLTLAAGAAWAASPVAALAAEKVRAKRPNLVIILADDLSQSDVGCYGNVLLRTPHIDSLARDGLRFTRAFTAEAICSPSRSTLYTGLYPMRHGCHMNHGQVKAGTRSLPHFLKPLGYRVALAGKKHIKPEASFPFEQLPMRGVSRFVQSSKDTPFCLIVASHEPHSPHQTGGYDAARVPVPPTWVDTTETRDEIAAYYTDINTLDREVGEVLATLKQNGLEEDTLVIFASDHGEGFFAKWSVYDAGLRVPFIARWPRVIAPNRTTDAMISFVDVLPTFLEAAGATPPELDGRSFLPVLRGQKTAHRDHLFATYTNRGVIAGTTYPMRAIRTQTHKYIRNLNAQGSFQNLLTRGATWESWREKARTDTFAAARVRWLQHRPEEELYDLRADPHEMANLAAHPAQRELVANLRGRVDAWMAQQNDRGLAAELEVPLHRHGRRDEADG
ncbi:MAG: sulfatase [Armatimonadetes bacterium]|nr:sulfatase [Armatimonadota bacterium]